VVLDAGHGGHDPGAIYHGLREKHLTLDITRRLRTLLEREGFTVVMTREGDQFIPLSGRAGLANRLHADLFVSIHVNANTNGHVSGAEVYYPRESVVAPSAQWPPYLSSSEIGVPSAVVKQVLWDLVLRRTRAQSSQLASAIASMLQQGLRVPSKVKAARFVVLREVWMPAVLVEVGYVSNYQESQRLNTPSYREAAAQAIASGIISYIRSIGAEHI
jgi:N-acetylmuramoyl-L-alanine amidase